MFSSSRFANSFTATYSPISFYLVLYNSEGYTSLSCTLFRALTSLRYSTSFLFFLHLVFFLHRTNLAIVQLCGIRPGAERDSGFA